MLDIEFSVDVSVLYMLFSPSHVIVLNMYIIFAFYRETKCEGLQGFRRLSAHHPEFITQQLHAVCLAIVAEVYLLLFLLILMF